MLAVAAAAVPADTGYAAAAAVAATDCNGVAADDTTMWRLTVVANNGIEV